MLCCSHAIFSKSRRFYERFMQCLHLKNNRSESVPAGRRRAMAGQQAPVPFLQIQLIHLHAHLHGWVIGKQESTPIEKCQAPCQVWGRQRPRRVLLLPSVTLGVKSPQGFRRLNVLMFCAVTTCK